MHIFRFARARRTACLVVAAAAIPVAAVPGSSWAGHDLGYRWPAGIVPVVNNAGPKWEPAISEAISDWNAISEHVELSLQPGAAAGCEPIPGSIAVCRVKKRSLGHAQLFPGEANVLRSVSITLGPRALSSPDLARSVMCHELGHALGLGHRDGSSASCLQERAGNLHPDPLDGSELNAYYETKPKVISPPACLKVLSLKICP